jgi:hypothetical protein
MCANGKASTAWSSGRRMGVAPGFEREVTTMIDSVLNLQTPHPPRHANQQGRQAAR